MWEWKAACLCKNIVSDVAHCIKLEMFTENVRLAVGVNLTSPNCKSYYRESYFRNLKSYIKDIML